jgi:hypothetical protein
LFAIYRIGILVNSAATLAKYFVNGTNIGEITANIPSGIARAVGQVLCIRKKAGTAASVVKCDYGFFRTDRRLS